MSVTGLTLTVTDPRRRRPLAVHAGLIARDAAELAAIYRAFGYPAERIMVSTEHRQGAA